MGLLWTFYTDESESLSLHHCPSSGSEEQVNGLVYNISIDTVMEVKYIDCVKEDEPIKQQEGEGR